MIEEGIVQLVNADSTVRSLAPIGGFFVELPKDAILPSWSYLVVHVQPISTLLSVASGLKKMTLQIDCYGATAANAMALAKAISHVLDGYQGTLSDPDSTFVSAAIPDGGMDFFDDARRSYRRMIEYEILFAQD
jgi:hypothetical protein